MRGFFYRTGSETRMCDVSIAIINTFRDACMRENRKTKVENVGVRLKVKGIGGDMPVYKGHCVVWRD